MTTNSIAADAAAALRSTFTPEPIPTSDVASSGNLKNGSTMRTLHGFTMDAGCPDLLADHIAWLTRRLSIDTHAVSAISKMMAEARDVLNKSAGSDDGDSTPEPSSDPEHDAVVTEFAA